MEEGGVGNGRREKVREEVDGGTWEETEEGQLGDFFVSRQGLSTYLAHTFTMYIQLRETALSLPPKIKGMHHHTWC